MTTLNMPLDIARDLLRTSREYASLKPVLAAEMARRAFEIGREFDVADQLGQRPVLTVDAQERDVETPAGARPCCMEDHAQTEEDHDDQDALISLPNLQRSALSEGASRGGVNRRRPKAHLSIVSSSQ